MFELKSAEESCLIALKIDAKFEGKLTCAFKNDIMISKIVISLILEGKLAELNQNKKLKYSARPDAVSKLYFTLEINE